MVPGFNQQSAHISVQPPSLMEERHPKQLKWKDTVARSGRLKNHSYTTLPGQSPTKTAPTSQRGYKIRFREDVKSRPRRGSRQTGTHRQSLPISPLSARSPGAATQTRIEGIERLASSDPLSTISELPSAHDHRRLSELQDARLLFSLGSADNRIDETIPELADDTEVDFSPQSLDTLIQGPLEPGFSEALLHTFQDDVFPMIARHVHPSLSPSSVYDCEDRKFFFQYYVERVVARLMPLWNTPDNPFISIIIPASFDSPVLTHAIMALSVYHYSLQPANPSNCVRYSHKALWHQQRVLSLLQESLANPETLNDDSTLAACMLMQTFEVLCSGTSGWDHWLRGATLFVQMRGQLEHDLKDSNNWMRLAKCVVAVETFAATSAGFELTISGDYWNIYRKLREDDLKRITRGEHTEDFAEDQHFEKLVGCPAVVVYALGRMQMLVQARDEVEQLQQDDQEWQEAWDMEVSKLEDLLLRWRQNSPDSDRVHLAEAFRYAALIFHARRLRRFPHVHATCQFRVQATFDHLFSLTHSSQLEGIALYPTLIAALEIDEAQNEGLQRAALSRIRVMKREKADPLYDNAEKLLHLVWSRRAFANSYEEKIAIDWQDISQDMNWTWCMV